MKTASTYLLVATNLAIYAGTSVIGGNLFVTNIEILLFLGQVNALVMQGWYWQLITAMFVHVNIIHIASNMVFLLIFGMRTEELFKPREFYLIYFTAGLAGNLLTLLAGPYSFYASAGASGAIFGLFGANTIYLRKILDQPLTAALVYAFIFLMLSVSANVNIIAHFGGLVAGLLIGYLIGARSGVVRQRNKVIIVR